MSDDRELIERIQTFLRSDAEMDVEELAGLAEEYAAACRKVNQRLQRCRSHLDSGLRSEAVTLAEQTPPVLERVARLVFHGHEQWRSVCEEHRKHLEVPPKLDRNIVSRLNDAYCPDQKLEELLSEYRASVHRGDLKEKIRLVRRIAARDTEDPQRWISDLKGFERSRLEEIEQEIESARRDQELDTLESLKEELDAEEWRAEVPEDLRNKLNRGILKIKRSRANKKANEIAEEVWNAYGALNYDRANRALHRWAQLTRKNYFDPPAELARNVEEVREWCSEKRDEKKRKQKFDATIEDLQEEIRNEGDVDRIKRLLFQAEQYDEDVPEYLRQRAEQRIADAELTRKRRWRAIAGAAGVVILLAGFLLYWAISASNWNEAYRDYLAGIKTAYEQENYETARGIIEDMGENYPAMMKKPKVIEWRDKLKAAEREVAADKREFDGIMDGLEQARSNGFPGGEYSDTADKAKELIHGPEQRQRFASWEAAWREHKQRVRQQKLDRIKTVTEGVASVFKKLKSVNPRRQLERYGTLIQRAAEGIDKVRDLSEEVDTRMGAIKTLENQLKRRRERLREAREWQRKHRQLLEKLTEAQHNLGRYVALVEKYRSQFPNGPENERLKKIQSDIKLGKDLMRVNDWKLETGLSFPASAQQLLNGPQGQKTVWQNTLGWWREVAGTASERKKLRDKMDNMSQSPLFTKVIMVTNKDGEKVFSYDMPELKGGGGGSWGYRIKALKSPSRFSIRTVVVKEKLQLKPKNLLAQHCRWVREFKDKLSNTEPVNYGWVTLKSLEELGKDKKVESVVKGRIFRDLLHWVVRAMCIEDSSLSQLSEKLDKIEMDVPWMSYKRSFDVVTAREKIQKKLKDFDRFSPLRKRLEMKCRTREKVLNRSVSFVGVVDKDDGAYRFKVSRAASGELWIVRENQTGQREVYVAAEETENGQFRAKKGVRQYLYKGCPVYAPRDGQDTERMGRMLIPHGFNPPEKQWNKLWPDAWPVNERPTKKQQGGN